MSTVTAADLNRRLRDLNKRHDKALKDAITALTASAVNQAALIAALAAKTQRVNTSIGPLAIATPVDVTITWDSEWPDLGYGVWIQLTTGNAALGGVHATLKAGSKTTTECVVTVTAALVVATVGLDVLGART
jgi:hypothetical protein